MSGPVYVNERPNVVFVVVLFFVAISVAAVCMVATIGDVKCWQASRGWAYEWSFAHGCQVLTRTPVYVPIEEFLSQQPNKEQ